MRRVVAYLVTAPLVVAGSLLAHQLDYFIAAPDPGDRAALLARTGHGYLAHLPLLLGVLFALAAVGACCELAAARGRSASRRVAAWPFALAAPLEFALQEHAERIAGGSGSAWHVALEPTFARGMALQVPFALAAWLLARLLLGSARRIGERLRRDEAPSVAPAALAARRLVARAVLRRSGLAGCAAGRAPPAVAA